MATSSEQLKQIIRRELPALLREDPSLRDFVLRVTREEFAPRAETDDRFILMLDELRRDREANERKWEEQNRSLRAFQEEQALKWDEQNRKWEEQNRSLRAFQEEQARKWDEQGRKWDEQGRKWEENSARFDRVHEEIMALARRVDRSIGALGARWGTQSEKAFRDALAAILEESFGVEVVNVNEYDDTGEVFGRPDQVELDLIIKNGLLIICELKSSIDKAGIYVFERKARFYERRHQRTASRLIVVSPMIDKRARAVGERLGIEMYGDSLDVVVSP